jgi:hypothetical protein
MGSGIGSGIEADAGTTGTTATGACTAVTGALLPLPHAEENNANKAMHNRAAKVRKEKDCMMALLQMKELPSCASTPSHPWQASSARGN